MPPIQLALLDPHPDNVNRMAAELMDKLARHIRHSGLYPPLIVRPHPQCAGRYQILDGHHRAEILRRLGFPTANCDVWNVDDDQAATLLLTLNRLHGLDDPAKRGELMARLRQSLGLGQLAELLPEREEQIHKLMELASAARPPAKPPRLADLPHAVTFFLTLAQRGNLYAQLDAIDSNRSAALVQLLDLENAR